MGAPRVPCRLLIIGHIDSHIYSYVIVVSNILLFHILHFNQNGQSLVLHTDSFAFLFSLSRLLFGLQPSVLPTPLPPPLKKLNTEHWRKGFLEDRWKYLHTNTCILYARMRIPCLLVHTVCTNTCILYTMLAKYVYGKFNVWVIDIMLTH